MAAATLAGAPDLAERVVRCGSTPLTTATWFHIAGVYDAGARTLDVYLNGVRETGAYTSASPPVPATIPPSSYCPYLGAFANQNNLLVGMLDDVRIYSRALTATEIARVHEARGE